MKEEKNNNTILVITIGVILFFIYLMFFAPRWVVEIWNWFIVGRY